MPESDNLFVIREILADDEHSRTVAEEVYRSYRLSDTEINTQEKTAAHFGTTQGQVCGWLTGKSQPASITGKPEKMLELLATLDLDVNSLGMTSGSAQARTCINPDCPTLRFYLIDGSVVASPRAVRRVSAEKCTWCRKPLVSICECGRPISHGAFCRCSAKYIAGLPRSFRGLERDALEAACERLNARNANICGDTIIEPWRAA
jgi:hypothetical protein